MKFLVDAQLPPAMCGWLSDRGHDAIHIVDVRPGATPDRALVAMAVAERRILVSKDEDFAFRYPSDTFTLLWLRCGNTTKASLFAWLEPRWSRIERLLDAGERMIEVR